MTQAALLADPRLPLYQRLREAFERRIVEGEWRPGEPIPAEDELAARHGVAVGTVRKAIEGLVADGRLERRQGRGTFVRRADFSSALARFFRVTDAAGRPMRPSARILSLHERPAPPEARAALGLTSGSNAIEIRRQRLIDGAPILGETIWLDAKRFAPLAAIAPADFGDLLYPLYERACGAIVASARETLRFGALGEADADLLGAAPGLPIVVIDRLAFGLDERVLEFRRSVGPADRFAYAIDIR